MGWWDRFWEDNDSSPELDRKKNRAREAREAAAAETARQKEAARQAGKMNS